MEKDTRKYAVNIQDPKVAKFVLAIDPLNYEVKEEFDFKILNEHLISLLGVQIYVKGVIHSAATPLDVLNGFNRLMSQEKNKTNIDKDKLLRCIYRSEQQDRNISFKISELTEPKAVNILHALVSLLRLSYYYYRCLPIPTFDIKANEVKTKISGSLANIEINSTSFENKMNILTDDIKDYCTELMFAALVLNARNKVTFDTAHDLYVDNIPCEVKTIHDKYYIYKDDTGKIIFTSKKEEFGEISLSNEWIAQILRTKWRDDLRTAINHQKGGVIFFNTYSTVLHDLNSRCNEDLSCLPFKDILTTAITSANNDDTTIPLVCCSCIIGSTFDQQFFLAKIPVKSLENDIILDEEGLNESSMSENILYQKYH